ncbi:putative pentatricopeptide repeat-containing protein At5g52630 [Curcuma longa]|uniref:putative pentatricopeptide repeat-containing protein At5g52630 n=1 Tax=Curcuma longa TaxID=136217 RepID=UPI003D9FA074
MISRLPVWNLPHNVCLRFLDSYIRSGQLDRARDLLDKIPHPHLPSLTILISAFTRRNLPKESIRLYQRLRETKDLKPDRLVLLSVAKACACSLDPVEAKGLHEEAIKFGLASDLLLGNAMIDMYGKCGFHQGSRKVFDDLPIKDVISWTSLISAYLSCRMPVLALSVFRDMLHGGVDPNSFTLSTAIRVCSELKALGFGREIHSYALRKGFEDDVFVGSGLVDLYANCSSIRQARSIFNRVLNKDSISWIVMLTAYFADGDCEEAMKLFEQMRYRGVATSSALWNCMISGFAQNGKPEQAFGMLHEMQHSGFKPNHITLISMLPVCAFVENLRKGREIHGYICRHWFVEDLTVSTALILMYAKCGDLDKARHVFNHMHRKDTVAWNTMILTNSMHGCGEDALSVFHQMLKCGVKPNSVTFTVVLTGCSHSQLVVEGKSIFHSMSKEHGLQPDADHYACMVDVLGRSGHLEEAYELIQNMPMQPTVGAWGALLASCRVYKNVELAKIAAAHLFEIEPENPGNYVLLSNILVSAKMWDEASSIRVIMRDRMRDRCVTKVPGCSWVQVRDKVYTFVKGDDKNPHREAIYGFLKDIREKMRFDGYLPDTEYVLQDVAEEEKEELLCSHSEKLAVAFGILNVNSESVIRVFKNLRICGDCHNTIKFMAKFTGLQIIVRDNVRFHHFRDGNCSCKDLW